MIYHGIQVCMPIAAIGTNDDSVNLFQLFMHDRDIFTKPLSIDTSC